MFVAEENQDLCMTFMCVMMLLDSRSQFINHKKYNVEMLVYTALINYWGQCPPTSYPISLKVRGNIFKNHTLYLGHKCNQRLFSFIKVQE